MGLPIFTIFVYKFQLSVNQELIIGQHPLKKSLANLVKDGKVPHATMFLGPKGSGKLALAMVLASSLMCHDAPDGVSCGNCNSCKKQEKMVHPDIHFSFPFLGSKVTSDHFLPQWRSFIEETPYRSFEEWMNYIGAENKQGNINTLECVHITKKLNLKSFEGNKKILIMWLPEFLGKEGNRLLKLIEEPPENTFFILISNNQDLILNTILSRCQMIKLSQCSDDEIQKGLTELEGVSEEKAKMIARIADGNYHEALKLKNEVQNDYEKLFVEWLRKCYKGKKSELVTVSEQIAAMGREPEKQFFKYGLHFLREMMLLKFGDRPSHLPEDQQSSAVKLGSLLSFEQLESMAEVFTECIFYIERNANPKILLLNTSIQLHKIMRNLVTA